MDARKKELLATFKQQPLEGGICIIRNTKNGRYLLEAQTNPSGSKNRFSFAQITDSAPIPNMSADWKECGKCAFSFEILEQLTQEETQTPEQFRADLKALGELWAEKFDPALSYR